MNHFIESFSPEHSAILEALFQSSESIYHQLKSGFGLDSLNTTNATNDEQIELDVFADQCFQKNIKQYTDVKYILSEESSDFILHGSGEYSIALDPLDGSKSAKVGIPCGSIFGVFENAKNISDFSGSNIMMSGFFLFGINLEVYLAIDQKAYKGIWNDQKAEWGFTQLNNLPSAKMIAINASNENKWAKWLQEFYKNLINVEDNNGKTFNMRWYASMVAEMKRLILQGGLFAYPSDRRNGYANGHLRLVYEAIPMAYLIHSLGGASSNGKQSLLDVPTSSLHQKTPIFLGEKALIQKVEQAKKS